MWRPLIWRRVECYYGQVGLNQAQISDPNSAIFSQVMQNISELRTQNISRCWIRSLQSDQFEQFLHQTEFFFISISRTTWMFLVYPIRPHFLGHNFLSLNPSISDKRNIQTLAEDSDRNILMWSPPILHILSNWNIPIWCRVVPAWIAEYCWVMMFLSQCLLVECFAITNSLYLC